MSKANRNAIFAFQAIKAYARAVKTPVKESEVLLTDLLADLRFWADSKGLDFGTIDCQAEDHYMAEVMSKHRAENGPEGNCAKCARVIDPKAHVRTIKNGGLWLYCSNACEESH